MWCSNTGNRPWNRPWGSEGLQGLPWQGDRKVFLGKLNLCQDQCVEKPVVQKLNLGGCTVRKSEDKEKPQGWKELSLNV